MRWSASWPSKKARQPGQPSMCAFTVEDVLPQPAASRITASQSRQFIPHHLDVVASLFPPAIALPDANGFSPCPSACPAAPQLLHTKSLPDSTTSKHADSP